MKWLLLFWAAVMVVWAVLEGGLLLTVFAAFLTALLVLMQLFRRYFQHRQKSNRQFLFLAALAGAALGFGGGSLTIVLMAIKTGLHAHGPEFSTAELIWVLQQIPLWTVVGLLAGLGLGLLVKAGTSGED
jgi:hypothetical protein